MATGSTGTTGKDGAREGWSSKSAFVLAAIGSAVGLGNLWRFPSEAGANGGGAFVLFYILCIVLIGLPVLLSETLIGRYGQNSSTMSARKLAMDSGKSKYWEGVAGVGIFAAFLVASFYCVVGGWVLYYVGLFAVDIVNSGVTGGAFEGHSVEQLRDMFPALLGSAGWTVAMDLLFVGITGVFIYRGVSKGIEVMAVWLMPAFFVLLLAITIYGAFSGAFAQSIDFLFSFEPEKLTGEVMLAAVGQAFFSLSLGMAGMITYGSYVGRDVNLASTSLVITLADTSVALIAGLCIFPIVFAAGLASDGGPGLLFQTLPVAFQSIPGGAVVGLFFFLMVSVAALTSSVALLEVPTSWAMEKFGTSRPVTAIVVVGAIAVLGVLAALSFNLLANVHPLGFIPFFAGMGIFDTLDTVTAKFLIPIGAILVCILVGWVADNRLVDAENGITGGLHVFWRLLVRWLCPVMLTLILIFGIFG